MPASDEIGGASGHDLYIASHQRATNAVSQTIQTVAMKMPTVALQVAISGYDVSKPERDDYLGRGSERRQVAQRLK
jgi:hypothetical protein